MSLALAMRTEPPTGPFPFSLQRDGLGWAFTHADLLVDVHGDLEAGVRTLQTWRWKGVWDASRDFHIWSKEERRNWNHLFLSLGVQTVICGTLPVLLATLRVREHCVCADNAVGRTRKWRQLCLESWACGPGCVLVNRHLAPFDGTRVLRVWRAERTAVCGRGGGVHGRLRTDGCVLLRSSKRPVAPRVT